MRNTLSLDDIKKKYGERVYPLYKEEMNAPYMLHKDKMGLDGAILTDGEKIRCDLCGKWFKSLSLHLKIHKITVREYKKERGLGIKTALCSVETSSNLRKAAKQRPGIKRHMRKINKLRKYNIKQLKSSLKGRQTMQYRNKFALCPEQMALRYAVISIEYGKFIDPMSIKNIDRTLWDNISKFYGTFPKFFKAIKINPKKTNWELPSNFIDQFDDKLIAIARLREVNLDDNGNCTEKVAREQLGNKEIDFVIDVYGSWRSATIFAGVTG